MTAAVNVATLTWSHVVATYDGSTIRLYINATEVSNLAYTASPTSNGTGLRIGRRWDAANEFYGVIDEAAIYPTALSPARLMAHDQARFHTSVPTHSQIAPSPPPTICQLTLIQ